MWIMKITLIIFLLTPLSAFAADMVDLINGQASKYDKNQRKQLAEKLSELFETLDNSIPSLKPSEQNWVDEERKAIAKIGDKENMGRRLAGLHESVEFQQENIKRHTKSIQDSLLCVMQAQDLRKEIYCWTVVSLFLREKGEFDGGIAILIKGKKFHDTGKMYLVESMGYGYFYNLLGRGIQEYFVIPYLAGTLRK